VGDGGLSAARADEPSHRVAQRGDLAQPDLQRLELRLGPHTHRSTAGTGPRAQRKQVPHLGQREAQRRRASHEAEARHGLHVELAIPTAGAPTGCHEAHALVVADRLHRHPDLRGQRPDREPHALHPAP